LDVDRVIDRKEISRGETMFPDSTITFWTTTRDWPGIVFPLFGKLINLTGKKVALFLKKSCLNMLEPNNVRKKQISIHQLICENKNQVQTI